MSLTTTEELNITSGLVGPDAYSLLDYVHQTGVQYAEDFMTEYKIFPTVDGEGNPINQLATSYLNKMLSGTSKAITSDSTAGVASSGTGFSAEVVIDTNNTFINDMHLFKQELSQSERETAKEILEQYYTFS